MADEKRERVLAPKGNSTTIKIGGQSVDAFGAVHHSGSGPGLLLISDRDALDAGLEARANLFGQKATLSWQFPTDGASPISLK